MSREAHRDRGREHIPNYPSGFIILRILQFANSIAIMGLCSYAIYILAFSGDCLMLATSAITLIVTVWLILAPSCAPQTYNYWAVLAFEIFLYILWVAAFALLAAQTEVYWTNGTSWCYDDNCSYVGLTGSDLVYGCILATASVLAAIQFLFFKISLIIHSVVVCRHRRAGHHSKRIRLTTVPYQTDFEAQGKLDYEAVPQVGLTFGQDTAYNPRQLYSPPTAAQAQLLQEHEGRLSHQYLVTGPPYE